MEKEIRKICGESIYYDDESFSIYVKRENKEDFHLLMVRGWSELQHKFSHSIKAVEFQDNLGKWIAETLNKQLTTPTEKEFLEASEVEGSILYCGMAGKGFCPYEKKNGECIMKDPCKNHTMQTK